MPGARFTLSAFGDEIDADLAQQCHLLRALEVGYLELRSAWGINVRDLDGDGVAAVRRTCADYGIAVSCLGSPVGKSPLAAPIEHELAALTRLFQVGEALGTRRIRVFSFYPPDTSTNAHYDAHLEEATARLAALTEPAAREGFTLLLENEKQLVGDTPARCHAILRAIDSPHLRAVWDSANYVQVGVAAPVTHGWLLLADYVAYVHIKDAVLTDGSVRAAGEGDGQLTELLAALAARGYQGFLALEPHLAHAGHSGGFSGPEGMAYAATAVRELMARLGLEEQLASAG